MARGFVKQRGGKWYAYWRDPEGKQKGKAVGSKRDAERFLAKTLNEMNEGSYAEIKDMTFGEFAETWLNTYVAVYGKKSTRATVESQVRKHFIPKFGARKLSKITTRNVMDFVAEMKESGLSDTTLRQYVVTLKTIFNHAVKLHHLKVSPADGVKLPAAAPIEPVFLTPEEIRAFLDALPDEHRCLFQTLVMTGMRIGEALALEWGDIHWDKGVIRISKNDYRGTIQTPKTLKGIRTVGMSQALGASLKAHRSLSETSRVFTIDGKPIRQHTLRPIYLRAIKDAEVRFFRIHDLRHTFASILINAGANLKYVQQQMGHASITTTVDRYGHLVPEAHRAAGAKMDATLFGDVAKENSAG